MPARALPHRRRPEPAASPPAGDRRDARASRVLAWQRATGNAGVARALLARAAPAPPAPKPAAPVAGPVRVHHGPYRFGYSELNPSGKSRLVAYRADTGAPVGHAEFRIEDRPRLPGPAPHEPYTLDHVRGGKVAHLTALYNETLDPKAEGDICRGFADQLMTQVETMAKRMGATLVYLEPATSGVRDPAGGSEQRDSTGFYTRHGYAPDVAQESHNERAATERFGRFAADDRSKLVAGDVRFHGQGVLVKRL